MLDSTAELQDLSSSAETMRAMSATDQGVKIIELPKPIPKKGEVRVKIIASAVNPGEAKVIEGTFVGQFLRARTAPLVFGWDFLGIINHLGDDVTDLDSVPNYGGTCNIRGNNATNLCRINYCPDWCLGPQTA